MRFQSPEGKSLAKAAPLIHEIALVLFIVYTVSFKADLTGRTRRDLSMGFSLHFRKMHGLGNDFAIFDLRSGGEVFSPDRIRALADRKTGIGFDQIVFLKHANRLDMYNADGTSLEACGNASRCVAKLLMEESGEDRCVLETVAGLLSCWKSGEGISVDMGVPRLEWTQIPLSRPEDTACLSLEGNPVSVNMGNPHVVFFVEDVEPVPLETVGPTYETHPLFPERVNVSFCELLSRKALRLRVWERGAGITRACGTAACAAAVAGVRRGLTDRHVEVFLDGGTLEIAWNEENGHVLMTGPASSVFEGTLSRENALPESLKTA